VRPRHLLLFFVVSALSGSAYVVIKLAVTDLSPAVVACARATLGATILLPLAGARGALSGLSLRKRQLIVLGFLEFAAPFLLLSAGSQWIASSLAGILMAAGPLFMALFALRLDASERVSTARMVGLIIGMTGVICLLGVTVAGRALELAGAGIVVLASCSFALGALYFKRHFDEVPPLGAMAGAMTFGALLLVPPAALALPAHLPTGSTIAAVGVLGIVHAALNYVLFFALVQLVGAGRASVTSYLSPAIAVLLGLAVLGEPADGGLVAGLLLIIAGSWLATGGKLPPGPFVAARVPAPGRHPDAAPPAPPGVQQRRLSSPLGPPPTVTSAGQPHRLA